MTGVDVERATLDADAEAAVLWRMVASKVRELSGVRQVLVSDSRREIVVIGNDYSHLALRGER